MGDGLSAPNVLGLPLPGVGDGATQSFLVVRLADGNGNIVNGKTVTLSANPSGSVVISPANGISSDDNGAVIFSITDLVQETVTFTATNTQRQRRVERNAEHRVLVPPAVSAGINATPTSVPSDGGA